MHRPCVNWAHVVHAPTTDQLTCRWLLPCHPPRGDSSRNRVFASRKGSARLRCLGSSSLWLFCSRVDPHCGNCLGAVVASAPGCVAETAGACGWAAAGWGGSAPAKREGGATQGGR